MRTDRQTNLNDKRHIENSLWTNFSVVKQQTQLSFCFLRVLVVSGKKNFLIWECFLLGDVSARFHLRRRVQVATVSTCFNEGVIEWSEEVGIWYSKLWEEGEGGREGLWQSINKWQSYEETQKRVREWESEGDDKCPIAGCLKKLVSWWSGVKKGTNERRGRTDGQRQRRRQIYLSRSICQPPSIKQRATTLHYVLRQKLKILFALSHK